MYPTFVSDMKYLLLSLKSNNPRLKFKPKLVPDLMVILLDPHRLFFGVYLSKKNGF